MLRFSSNTYKEIERLNMKLWSNTFFSGLDRPTGQIGGRVARQRCPIFDLSTINASLTREYPAEFRSIELAEFFVVDGSPGNRHYCIVGKQKNLTHYTMVTVQTWLLGNHCLAISRSYHHRKTHKVFP